MKLRETTKKMIFQLEEKSGYPVQVVEDKSLPVSASLRIARGHLPAHILSFNTLPESSLDFMICWQCAMALRLFHREPDQRFQIASSPESSRHLENILYAPDGVVNKYGLDIAQAASLLDQLLQGMIVHLYSIAVGLRVSDRLTLDYPELTEFESQHVEDELRTNLSGLSEQVQATLPREVFDATHKINTAYALYWSRRLEKPEVVNPYRSRGFESAGRELLKIFERIPSDAAHDYELVDGSNVVITGGVDDMWINHAGEYIVVDYKSTSKDGEITLDADWQIGYKRQMEIYQWLFRKNGFRVSDTGYFVYCNGNTDKEAFDGRLEFDVKIIPYEGDISWVEQTILEAIECLKSRKLPFPGSDCDFCKYRRAAVKAVGQFANQ